MDIEKLLTKYFCDHYNIVPGEDYKIEMIEASELLVPERLDLIAKLIWLDHKNNGYNMGFANFLYEKHLEAITGGTCIEGGKEEKDSTIKYLKVFEELEKNISLGFDKSESIIPVGKNNAIMDGSHRTAICIYHNLKIPIVRFNHLEAHNDAAFFLNGFMDADLVDFMVTEYCKRKENVYAVCIWPRGGDKATRENVEKLIRSSSKIIHRKEVDITSKGLRNLMIQIYCRHEWMGNANSHFSGASDKSFECWRPDKSTIFYIIEGPTLPEVLELKQRIRDLFGVGNHSVHITDNQVETLQMANLLLNKNSLHLINEGKPDYFVKLNVLIEEFKQKLLAAGKDLDNYIIDSSGVLGLYGIREASDLDYLTIDDHDIDFGNNSIDDHKEYLKYHQKSVDELLNNPENYLLYNEIKFISLKCARDFKQNRAEKKDLDDIRLIDTFLANKFSVREYMFKLNLNIRRSVRNTKTKTRLYIKKIPMLYTTLRKIKHIVTK